MRKGFATIFRDLAILLTAITFLVGFTGRSDGPFLVVILVLALSALVFILLRHHRSKEEIPQPQIFAPTTTKAPIEMPDPTPMFLSPEKSQRFHGESIRVFLNALPDPILVLDSHRRILLANKSAHDLFGAQIETKSLLAVLRQPGLLSALDKLARGDVPKPLELPDIAGHALIAHVQPIGRLNDEIASALIIFQDVSNLRRAETLRSDFVANVSHELKTPLATLIGFLETLKGSARNDEQARARFLDIMLTEAQRMSRLVADLLSLSRIELNEYQPPQGETDLKRLFAAVIDGLALKAQARGIVIHAPDPRQLLIIPGDSDELMQVMQNLIDNAIKYGRDHSVITISANVITDPAMLRLHLPHSKNVPAAMALSVTDQGPGIAREHIPRLTERFFRIDTARSRDLGGTGLGLAIVKHIVSRHRGKLEIQSVLGEGSTFTIYLPMDVLPPKSD